MTFVVFAYNQEKYIVSAVESAFSQTYEPLEIILSDDQSTDRTFEIMQEMAALYTGRHHVKVRKNQTNLGLAGHINKIIECSSGDIVTWLAGDDIATSERTEIFVEKIQEDTDNIGVHSNVYEISEDGSLIGKRMHGAKFAAMTVDSVVNEGIPIISQSHAFKKRAFDYFGPLREDLTNEGIPLAFRELVHGKIVFIDDLLTYYRIGSGTSTYSGKEVLRRKLSEPQKISMWRLSAYIQLRDDVDKIKDRDLNAARRIINQNFIFYRNIYNINTNNNTVKSLVSNFFIKPTDTRTIRAVCRMISPSMVYKLFIR
ncbi:glycosyltransferase family 2 protein [Ancylobacter aquaticus]|uniref:glycosyltransferase family 2 protein n=1 Tax=Ancylobacter aquaticus TaxID=100 RepID=UPI001A9DD4FC|nr:glycosyltransferase family 2 protein [Ancylobacter aquaticus]